MLQNYLVLGGDPHIVIGCKIVKHISYPGHNRKNTNINTLMLHIQGLFILVAEMDIETIYFEEIATKY